MNETQKGPAGLEAAELVAAMDDLFEMWGRWASTGSVNLRPRPEYAKTQRQVGATVTLIQHLFELAKVVRPYLPDELPLTLIPVAREAFETGVWIIWMDKFRDAADAAVNDAERNRRLLAESMVDSALIPAEEAPNLPEWEKLPSDSHEHARSFKKMTDALDLPDIYAFYRALSQLSHPSVQVMDEYLSKDEDGRPIFHVRATPGFESVIVARVLPLFLVKAARIFTYVTQDKAQRSEVRAIGRRMAVDVDDVFTHH